MLHMLKSLTRSVTGNGQDFCLYKTKNVATRVDNTGLDRQRVCSDLVRQLAVLAFNIYLCVCQLIFKKLKENKCIVLEVFLPSCVREMDKIWV